MLGPAVRSTISALELEAVDDAVVRLAISYADVIDANDNPAWAMRWIGPELLACLTALGATPAARAAIKTGPAASPKTGDWLTTLRAAHKTA